jgi:hypothetical protein
LLTIESLKKAVHRDGISKTDAALLCVAAGGGKGVPTTSVSDLALKAGVQGAKKTNFSALLAAASGRVFKVPEGWELSEVGRNYIATLVGAEAVSPAAKEAHSLRQLLPSIKHEDTKLFIAEAVTCAETSLFRAAVVLSWVGAVSILYNLVLTKHLASFNTEATKRNPKWKTAKSTDDLAAMKESVFLEVLQAISAVGKNVRQELDDCLRLRNGCGHPNSLKVGANKVAAHLETLVQNVYIPFG